MKLKSDCLFCRQLAVGIASKWTLKGTPRVPFTTWSRSSRSSTRPDLRTTTAVSQSHSAAADNKPTCVELCGELEEVLQMWVILKPHSNSNVSSSLPFEEAIGPPVSSSPSLCCLSSYFHRDTKFLFFFHGSSSLLFPQWTI